MDIMLEPAHVLRAFFLAAASTILLFNGVPALRSRYLAYGPRATPRDTHDQGKYASKPDLTNIRRVKPYRVETLLDHLATYQVPHAYFTHFYIVSVVSSVFWGVQLLAQGAAVKALASYSSSTRPEESMSTGQVFLAWSLMAVQGLRRLYESVTLAKPSSAKMWFVHWLIGIGFYLAVGVAVWMEGVGTVVSATPKLDDLRLSPPSLGTLVCLPIFILASGVQYDCHAYLASLQKYTLPAHPAFEKLICPHYFAECLIYIALTFIAAPKGALVNKTVFTALIFVSVNLGVTADISRDWYAQKFGADKIAGKWRIIPLVY
ncbi:MAG: 3-oxo-5-alpha-steroid 4-dehydrogenase [Lasallia pustulata]|uniref:Polyprenal reductase n=1 Tax=Lasallia pustulata TaxID=136370 RepID=A0A5M8PH45_9LECA|nr:MAG: 3-oxo-5-alpha-steroid 4-dehydrogenase [Lasallia pustulata]